jgi:multidrug efflux pump subunit AcrA (membrane-fusion protein)
VRVQLNQVDLLKVHSGQRAQMRLDAYPGLTLSATLEEVSPLGHIGQFAEAVRSFTARFSVQGTDPRLLPDLSAALDLDLGSLHNALIVPCQSIGTEANRSFVWVNTGGSFEKRMVQLGPRNDLEAVIVSGLAEGDVIRRVASEDKTGVSRP